MSTISALSKALVPRGPDGDVISVEDLPPPNTIRWVAYRKSLVAAAVIGGLITFEDAVKRYPHLSDEELRGWIDAYRKFGVKGPAQLASIRRRSGQIHAA